MKLEFKDLKPKRQLLQQCVMIDEDYKVSTYKKHILVIEHNELEGYFLCCRACGMSD